MTATDVNAFNHINNQTMVTPRILGLPTAASQKTDNVSTFSLDVPPYSITVLQFDL